MSDEYANNIQLKEGDGALRQEYVGAGKYPGFVANMLSFANRNGFNVSLISGASNDYQNGWDNELPPTFSGLPRKLRVFIDFLRERLH